MNTIVMNTKTGAVTHHDLPFTDVTANFAASPDGLYALGGDKDGASNIDASMTMPLMLLSDSTQRNLLSDAYLTMSSPGKSVFTVISKAAQWPYPVPVVLDSGVTRVELGRGIKENYIGAKLQNAAGADFQLERIELRQFKSQRRI